MNALPRPSRTTRLALWTVALLVTLAAAVWQRRTGPSHPMRASVEVAGERVDLRLPRSAVTTDDAEVSVPAPAGVTGTLSWRRHPTDDPFEVRPMRRADGALVAHIPRQPPAGKVAYGVTLSPPDGALAVRVPANGDEPVILRYRGPVPAWLLIPHIAAMFLGILVGTRTALAALFGHAGTGRLILATFLLLTAGGMLLGPAVQWHAFGAWWTGWPNGHDLTDNKTLIMWGAWLLAGLAWLGARRAGRPGLGRAAVVAAFLVMLATYVVPHSARGSELDYDRLEEGVDPADAVRTGRVRPR